MASSENDVGDIDLEVKPPPIKIGKKITGWNITKKGNETSCENISTSEKPIEPDDVENIFFGATGSFKSPNHEGAFNVTVNFQNNDLANLPPTPYQVFFNTKNSVNDEYFTAIARLISLALKNGIPLSEITEQLKDVVSLSGFREVLRNKTKKPRFTPSFVAGIGYVIDDVAACYLARYSVAENKSATESNEPVVQNNRITEPVETNEYPASATLCPKCQAKAVVIMDGCLTCLSCGDSKCN